jgi:hypothetical protein
MEKLDYRGLAELLTKGTAGEHEFRVKVQSFQKSYDRVRAKELLNENQD